MIAPTYQSILQIKIVHSARPAMNLWMSMPPHQLATQLSGRTQ